MHTNLYCVCVLKDKMSKGIGLKSVHKEVSSTDKTELLEYFQKQLFVRKEDIYSLNLFTSENFKPVLLNRWKI